MIPDQAVDTHYLRGAQSTSFPSEAIPDNALRLHCEETTQTWPCVALYCTLVTEIPGHKTAPATPRKKKQNIMFSPK